MGMGIGGFDLWWLLVAGFGGGLVGSVAGLASLVSYPALLAVGVSAVSANVTNTAALVWSAAGSVWGFRPELSEQRRVVRRPRSRSSGRRPGRGILSAYDSEQRLQSDRTCPDRGRVTGRPGTSAPGLRPERRGHEPGVSYRWSRHAAGRGQPQ